MKRMLRHLLGRAVLLLVVCGFSLPCFAGAIVECVLVQVNGEIITLSEFEKHKKGMLEDLYRRKLPEREMNAALTQTRDRLLPDLIEEKLFLQKAKTLGLEVKSDELDRIIKTVMEQNRIADETALETALKSEGMTVPVLRRNIEKRTLIEKLKQFEIANKIVVTDDEAKRHYDEQRDDFRQPERVRLREIVLLTDKREEQSVRREIEELAALVRNGADFAELATLFSQAPTAEHGGDLGLVLAQDLTPEIAGAAATLEVGQVSAPVRTKFGFHILRLMERKPVAYQDFAAAKTEIVRRIQETRYGSKVEGYVASLRKEAFIQTNETCVSVTK